MAVASDLVLLDEDELVGRLSESRRELFNLRFQLATGQLDNSARIQHVRRDIARVLTVLRQREIAEAEGTFVLPSADEQARARAHLAAEDAAAEAARSAQAAPDGDEGVELGESDEVAGDLDDDLDVDDDLELADADDVDDVDDDLELADADDVDDEDDDLVDDPSARIAGTDGIDADEDEENA